MYELLDILTQIESIKKDKKYSSIFSYYDSSVGIVPIVSKLPYQWRERWTNRAADYKLRMKVAYPPFTYLVKFIQELSRVRNDPGFQYQDKHLNQNPKRDTSDKSVRVLKSQFHNKIICPIDRHPHLVKD